MRTFSIRQVPLTIPYFRFLLIFWDVKKMLAERGIVVSYETIQRWILKFGPAMAANVRSRRTQPTGTWHLDEVFVSISGKRRPYWLHLSCLCH